MQWSQESQGTWINIHILTQARVSLRPSYLDKILNSEGKGKNINGTKIDDKKKILQDLDRDDLTPPPHQIMTCPPPSAPPGPEAALMPEPGPGEVPEQPLLFHQLSRSS